MAEAVKGVRVRYDGPFTDGAIVRLPDGSDVVAKPGEVIEVPEMVAAGLLIQSDWKPSGKAAQAVAEEARDAPPAEKPKGG